MPDNSFLFTLIFHSLLLAGFMALLVRSAIFAVDSIVKFSKMVGISELAAGFAIVAISTSAPEISVAIFSVTSNNVGLTLGDIFGSNVTNIALIAAIFLWISPVRSIEQKTLKSLSPLLIVAAVIPILLLLFVREGNNNINSSRFIGIALLAFFAYYMYRTFKSESNRRKYHHDNDGNNSAISSEGSSSKIPGSYLKQIILFIIGMTIVIISARFIVESASAIAESTGVRESVIGASIIALGTSLPELAVDVVSVRRRHLNLALGDIIGSSVTNITLILGIVLVTSAAPVNFGILATLISFAALVHVVLFVFLRTGRITRWQSVVLFAAYLFYLISVYEVQVVFGNFHAS
jgi:cation:H+ antiporter